MNSVRITAHLDEQSQFDIQFLCKELGGLSITDVIKYSLHQSAQQLRETVKAQRQKQIWRESGLIASGCAPTDLSRNYKHYLGKTIDEKYFKKR